MKCEICGKPLINIPGLIMSFGNIYSTLSITLLYEVAVVYSMK